MPSPTQPTYIATTKLTTAREPYNNNLSFRNYVTSLFSFRKDIRKIEDNTIGTCPAMQNGDNPKVAFNDVVYIYSTYDQKEYDRTNLLRLNPLDFRAINIELMEYKIHEMVVHPESNPFLSFYGDNLPSHHSGQELTPPQSTTKEEPKQELNKILKPLITTSVVKAIVIDNDDGDGDSSQTKIRKETSDEDSFNNSFTDSNATTPNIDAHKVRTNANNNCSDDEKNKNDIYYDNNNNNNNNYNNDNNDNKDNTSDSNNDIDNNKDDSTSDSKDIGFSCDSKLRPNDEKDLMNAHSQKSEISADTNNLGLDDGLMKKVMKAKKRKELLLSQQKLNKCNVGGSGKIRPDFRFKNESTEALNIYNTMQESAGTLDTVVPQLVFKRNGIVMCTQSQSILHGDDDDDDDDYVVTGHDGSHENVDTERAERNHSVLPDINLKAAMAGSKISNMNWVEDVISSV